MKKLSKVSAIVLAVSILASLCSFVSFAEPETVSVSEILAGKYTAGTGYVAFGDSFARGYGASDNWVDEVYLMDDTDETNCRNVTGSYPLLIATALGLYAPNSILDTTAQYWPIAQDAVTTDFIVDLLGIEHDFTDKEFLYSHRSVYGRYKTDLTYFGETNSVYPGDNHINDGLNATYGTYGKRGTVKPVSEIVSGSRLVTVQLGMGDIFNRARQIAMDKYDISSGDTKIIIDCVEELVSRMYEGYNNWKELYPLLLDYLKEKACNATVVIVGTFNPLYNIDLSDEYAVTVGNALSAIISRMNNQYEKWAKEYGFIFVDISNVVTGATSNKTDISEFLSSSAREQGVATHPTPEGYAQIARMIVDRLEEKELNENPRLSNIIVDLGDVKSIEYVKLNGIEKNDYTYKNNVLTVPCWNILAAKLTVCTKSNGKSIITTYDIDYNRNGYSATRVKTVNEESTVSNKITTATKNVVTKIKNIFKKK